MNESQESKDAPRMFDDERTLAWMEEHRTDLEQYVSGERILYWSLGISFVVGLAAHVGGYALLSSAPRGLLGLLADLLHALGWSLWTGVVVALFVQVFPEVKRRQISRAVDAYEGLRRQKAKAAASRDAGVLEKPHHDGVDRERAKRQQRSRTRKAG